MEEGRHLTPCHEIIGTEPIVGRRVATPGHTSRRKAIDITLEHVTVVIDELVPAAVVGVPERPHKERRHLTTGHVVVGAEPVVDRRITASSDSGVRQPFDVGLEDMAVVVLEWVV